MPSVARPTASGAIPRTTRNYAKQNTLGGDERGAVLDEMQQYWYDQAPYHILFYDNNLHAYRTDKFTNWHNQPSSGTPLFAYGTLNYTLLELASDATPSCRAPPTARAVHRPRRRRRAMAAGPRSGGDNTLLIVGVLAVVVVVVGGVVLARRRGTTEADE